MLFFSELLFLGEFVNSCKATFLGGLLRLWRWINPIKYIDKYVIANVTRVGETMRQNISRTMRHKILHGALLAKKKDNANAQSLTRMV